MRNLRELFSGKKVKLCYAMAILFFTILAGMCITYASSDSPYDYLRFKTEGVDIEIEAIKNNGRYYIPVRKIFEILGSDIDWDEKTKTIAIYSKTDTGAEPQSWFLKYSGEITVVSLALAIASLVFAFYSHSSGNAKSDKASKKHEEEMSTLRTDFKIYQQSSAEVRSHAIIMDGVTEVGKTTLIKWFFRIYDNKPLVRTDREYVSDKLPVCFENSQSNELSPIHSYIFHDTAGEDAASIANAIEKVIDNLKDTKKFCILLVWDLSKNPEETNLGMVKSRFQGLYGRESVKKKIGGVVVFFNKCDLISEEIKTERRTASEESIKNLLSGIVQDDIIYFSAGSAERGDGLTECSTDIMKIFDLEKFLPDIKGRM